MVWLIVFIYFFNKVVDSGDIDVDGIYGFGLIKLFEEFTSNVV